MAYAVNQLPALHFNPGTMSVQHVLTVIHICHGRNSNLIEFETLPVETPIGLSAKFSLVAKIG